MAVISGNIIGQTQTLTLFVESSYKVGCRSSQLVPLGQQPGRRTLGGRTLRAGSVSTAAIPATSLVPHRWAPARTVLLAQPPTHPPTHPPTRLSAGVQQRGCVCGGGAALLPSPLHAVGELNTCAWLLANWNAACDATAAHARPQPTPPHHPPHHPSHIIHPSIHPSNRRSRTGWRARSARRPPSEAP